MSTDLSGLSPQDCPFDCNPATGCVITGNICGHPFKGGLQGASQRDPTVIARFQQARKLLANKKINLGGEEDAETPAAQAKSPKKKRKRSRAKPKKPIADAQPEAPAT